MNFFAGAATEEAGNGDDRMTKHNNFAAALWLLAAAVGLAAGVEWADNARSGLLTPWALVAFFWGVALVSVAIHYLAYYFAEAPHALKRYRFNHRAAVARWVGARFGK
jgi:hypothetical protein